MIKKLKSFFLNTDAKYTKWGLIVNWCVVLVPIALFISTFFIADLVGKAAANLNNLSSAINGWEGFAILIYFCSLGFMIYAFCYKGFRFVFKPKSVRYKQKELQLKGKAELFEDKFWKD